MEIINLIFGLIVLVMGSRLVINSAVKIASYFGISELLIGLTITSIGTSIPEIANSLSSSFYRLKGIETSGLVLGNIVGSNIINIALTLGIIAFFSVVYINKRSFFREGTLLISSVLILLLACVDGFISRLEGLVLLSIYIGYIVYLFSDYKVMEHLKKRVRREENRWVLNLFLVFVGLFLVISSSSIVIKSAVFVSEHFGINNVLIGLFVIAFGTTLPELTISLNAIFKGSKDLGIGTLLGSNITNPLLAIGSGSAISGFIVTKNLIRFDLLFLVFLTLVVLFLLKDEKKLDRSKSFILLGLFLIYFVIRLFVL